MSYDPNNKSPVDVDDIGPYQPDPTDSAEQHKNNNARLYTYERRALLSGPLGNPRDGHQFSLRQGNLALIRNVAWLWTGYVQHGALNSITGGGGAGKTTLVCWMIAQLSTGNLPGELHGKPADTLVLANEDDPALKWDPIVHANGGDVARVHTLEHNDSQPFNSHNPKHMAELAAHIRENTITFVVIDAVLDVMDQASDSHNQKHVRQSLAPFRRLCKETGVACMYMLHPNKASGANLSLRDRAGGSGQFTDVGRSNLFVGYHRDKHGYRAVTRGKANNGADPGAMVFHLEPTLVTNPETREQVEAVRLDDIATDLFLTSEELSTGPVKPSEPPMTNGDKIVAVAMQVGVDGQPKQLDTLKAAVMVQHDMTAGAFDNSWRDVKGQFKLDKDDEDGRRVIWRLKKP